VTRNVELNFLSTDPYYLAIYNSQGRLLRLESIDATTSDKVVDIQSLQPGNYFLKVFGKTYIENSRFQKI